MFKNLKLGVLFLIGFWSFSALATECDLMAYSIEKGLAPSTTYLALIRQSPVQFYISVIPLNSSTRENIELAMFQKQVLCLKGTKHIAQSSTFFAYEAYPL